jgi:hypothetical protein
MSLHPVAMLLPDVFGGLTPWVVINAARLSDLAGIDADLAAADDGAWCRSMPRRRRRRRQHEHHDVRDDVEVGRR